MKRLIALLLLAVLLTGCGGEAPQTTTQEPTGQVTSTNLGGKAPDLTFTDGSGQTISLYQLLESKKLVVLNFWYADCGWCRREFPVMEVSYQKYREDVEILALNPYDSQEAIAAFQEENGLTFPMLSCSAELATAFRVNGYPTSVCIDREGTVSLIQAGAITDSTVFDRLFATYTDEGYSSRIFNSINDILD